jgi:hypothetical protein
MNKLIAKSRQNNHECQIGGTLYWERNTGGIMQILEGSAETINILMEKIKRDKRHTDIITVSCNDIGTSDVQFPIWTAAESVSVGAISKQPSISDYSFLSIIGIGGTATVVLGEHIKTKKQYAIKMVTKRRINDRLLNRIITERNILSTIRHMGAGCIILRNVWQ